MKFKKVEITSSDPTKDPKKKIKKKIKIFISILLIIILITIIILTYKKYIKDNFEIEKIKKPLADKNKYKLLTLKKNSLQILLISSKETQKSSSSLAINVGSFYDLTPGLAHFCEHMLFLGNKKFQSEKIFSDTLSKYNGIYNAFTSNDKTVFYYESDNNGFIEIFNIFSSMFYSPLFDVKFIEKEINSVNSEHSKNINNDFWIIDFLVRREGNEKNPFWKFSCGNNETLGRINPYILQNELFSFFNCFYLPKNMKLVLYSNFTIYDMEKMIYDNFNFYKSENKNELILFKKTIDGLKLPVYEKGQIPKIMFYKPSSEKNLISIYFIINSLFYLYESKPEDYLFYYFQYEGKNSLIYILKEKELISEINIYVEEMFIEFTTIKISVSLTEKGIDNYEIVIKLIFDYLNLIKNTNINEYVFNEKKENSDNEFKFFQMKNLFDLVIEYSLNMFQYNEENILYGKYLHSKFDKHIINNFLNEITIDKCVIVISSQKDLSNTKYFTKSVKKVLPFYNREYQVSFFSKEHINELKENPNIINYEKIDLKNFNFSLRERNIFITKIQNLSTPCYEKNNNCIDNEYNPKLKNYSPLILDEFNDKKGFNAFYKIDNSFQIPKQNIFISITSDNYEIKNAMLNVMIFEYYNILKDILLSDIKGSGNEINIKKEFNKIIFKINCYNDLSEIIIKKIQEIIFHDNIEEKYFNQIKSRIPSLIAKKQSELAFLHTIDIFHKYIIENATNIDDLINIDLNSITYNNFSNFYNNFKNNININLLIHGVTYKIQSKLLSQILYNKMINNENKIIKEINQKIIKPKTILNLYFKNTNKGESNHVTSIFYQFDKYSYKQIIYMEMFKKCIGNIFFTELRTNKQLGYIVKGMSYEIYDHLYYLIIVQGEKKFPDEIDDLINEVVNISISKDCSNNFIEIKNAIKYQINRNENNINERTEKIFKEINMRKNDFEKESQLNKELDSIYNYEEVRKYMKNMFVNNPRRIGILYYANNIDDNIINERIQEKIKNNKKYSLNKEIKIEYLNKI